MVAVTITMTAKAAGRTSSGTWPPSSPPVQAPDMPAAPNTTPVRRRTRPPRAWSITPAAEVTPTTNKEVAMASLASMPAT